MIRKTEKGASLKSKWVWELEDQVKVMLNN